MIQDAVLYPNYRSIVSDLGKMLSDISSERRFSQESSSTLSLFSSRKPVNISVKDYVERLIKFTQIEGTTVTMALIYIDRLLIKTQTELTEQNFHRVFLVALLIAIKTHEDVHYRNDVFCKIGGVRLDQLNELEAAFLRNIEFKLWVSDEEYLKYFTFLSYKITAREN